MYSLQKDLHQCFDLVQDFHKINTMQKEFLTQYPTPPQNIARQISQLSCDQHYILLYPSPKIQQSSYKEYFGKDPYLLVFQDQDNLTQKDLAVQLIKETNIKLKPHYIYFDELKTQCSFRHMKLSQLKRIFQVQTIDGFSFKLHIFQSDIELQTGIGEMANFQKAIPLKQKSLVMYIQQINYYFNVQLQQNTDFNNFIDKTLKAIKDQLKVTAKSSQIKLSYTNDDLKEIQINQHNFKRLTNKDYIFVKLSSSIKLTEPTYPNQNSFIIIQDHKTKEQKKFIYKQIRKKKISTILDKDLDFEARKLKSNRFGLRIHDLVLKPCETFADFPILDQLFLGQGKSVKIVLALIVKESFVFYSHLKVMEEISGNNKAQFSKILQNSKQNENHRRVCEQAIKDRAKKAKHLKFKDNTQRIEPILYYTSQLYVRQSNKNKLRLYDAQNTFLRKMKFGDIKRQDYKKWQFMFANTLINNLKLLEQYNGDLYRGISKDLKHEVGKVIKFKQFSSCSFTQNVAQAFAGSTLYIIKNCKIARKIKEYSFFPHEDEVLNFPYSSYKVVNIEKRKTTHEINVVTLAQIKTPQLNFDLKDQKQLFIHWVDGQKGQGVQISRSVCRLKQTTFFIHSRSTEELHGWFKQNKQKIKDPTISLALITNMFRVQNGVPTQNAGALAIKVFKSYCTSGNILVYIGDIEKAKKMLTANEIAIGSNFKITNDQKQMERFLDYLGVYLK